jgi:hypothetical protein
MPMPPVMSVLIPDLPSVSVPLWPAVKPRSRP